MIEDPKMASRVVAVCREAGIYHRVEARLDNGLVLFVNQDEIYENHRDLPAGTFARNPCRFIASILGMKQ